MTLYEKCQECGDTSIHEDYVYIGQTGSGEIEIPLIGEQIKNICTSGNNDIAVEAVSGSQEIQTWMERYNDAQIQDALSEYGYWSGEELTDRQTNINRLVWTLAWDVFDSENPNESLAADDMQKVIEKGQRDWNYSRDYRYHNDKLVFAFVFDGTEEHRLYFKDDHMIRYIDENKITYDYPKTSKYSSWEEKVLNEAYSILKNTDDEQSNSAWLGTWTASSGESLEIKSVTKTGMSLIYNKYSEQGNMMNVNYEMEFDDDAKTIASEIGSPNDHGGWEYTFVLTNDYITVKSRYPDQIFYKAN